MTHDNSSSPLFVRIKGRVEEQSMQMPFIFSPISAGFPSPALDFMDKGIDLNKILIKNISATFLGQVAGNSMMKIGISDGDYIIIDKSLTPSSNDIVVCVLDGEFTLKRIQLEKEYCLLHPENDAYKTIKVTKDNEFSIWGVVIHAIKNFKCTR